MKRRTQRIHSPSGRKRGLAPARQATRTDAYHSRVPVPFSECPFANQGAHRQGFVLLMTLALLAIAGLLLASLARKSLNAAVSVSKRTESVQHRWATYSIQRSLLRRVEPILAANDQPESDEAQGTPIYQIAATIKLSGNEYQVDLADESAKVDLNVVHRANGDAAVRRTLSKFSGSGPITHLRGFDNNSNSGLPVFDSWGQVFETPGTTTGPAAAKTIRDATQELTLWSGGRLNIRRATTPTFRYVSNLVLVGADAGRLVKLRQEHPNWPIEELTNAASLNDSESQQFTNAFGTGSSGASLWIISKDTAEFHVSERVNGRAYTTSFTW